MDAETRLVTHSQQDIDRGFNQEVDQTIVFMPVRDLQISSKPPTKYLGVMIDCKINFDELIRRTSDKAAREVVVYLMLFFIFTYSQTIPLI